MPHQADPFSSPVSPGCTPIPFCSGPRGGAASQVSQVSRIRLRADAAFIRGPGLSVCICVRLWLALRVRNGTGVNGAHTGPLNNHLLFRGFRMAAQLPLCRGGMPQVRSAPTRMHSNASVKTAALAGGMLLLSACASAQKISAGAVAGGSLTSAYRDVTVYRLVPPLEPGASPGFEGWRFWSKSKDYVIGGMLEIRFNPRWSLEVNGLFRQLHGHSARVSLPEGSLGDASPEPVVTWEFPVLARYRFQGRRVNPFLEAGPSFRTTGNLNTRPSHHGIAAGAGLEMNWLGLKIAPAVRYTLWAGEQHTEGLQTAPDQIELLVGFSRESESGWRPLGRRVSLGFTLSTNLTGDFATVNIAHPGQPPAYRTSGPRSLIYGPMAEVRLPRRFSLEADALHRSVSHALEWTFDGRQIRSTASLATWVFPVLAKYRFPVRGLQPFLGLGPSFRMRQSFSDSSPYGVAAAAGLEMRAGPMGVTPAIRYTHWAPDRQAGGPVRNQLEAAVGFSF